MQLSMCPKCRRVFQTPDKVKACESSHVSPTHAVARFNVHDTDRPSIVLLKIGDTWHEFGWSGSFTPGESLPPHRKDPRLEDLRHCAAPPLGLSVDKAVEKEEQGA